MSKSNLNRTKSAGTDNIVNVTETITRSPEYRRTHSIKNQLIGEDDNLWGYVVEVNGVKKRVDSLRLYTMMIVDKVPVVVDWTGRDAPATLTIVHKRTKDGMMWFFKTLGDRFKKNNLANVPKLKAQSSHLRNIERIK